MYKLFNKSQKFGSFGKQSALSHKTHKSITTDQYLGKRKFGRLGNAKVDDSDEDPDDEFDPDLVNKTPMTRRKVKEEKILNKVEKLGCFSTFMTLIKGFVCTGCLYLPKSVINGGWLFSNCMLAFSCCLTMYCAMLLLDVRKKLNLTSYTEIGYKTYGNAGRCAVDFALWASQSGFCCAYVYFIKENFYVIFQ